MNKADKKIKRSNFFRYAGGAILGAVTIANMPFKSFLNGSTNDIKDAPLKISENPNAIKRKTGVSKNS